VKRLPEHALPGQVQSVVRLGEGFEHVAYEVNGVVIVRFATESDPARRARQGRTEGHVLGQTIGPGVAGDLPGTVDSYLRRRLCLVRVSPRKR